MSFANLYYKRTAATEKACYACNRPTTTVLATKDSVDFFYACDGHLEDSGFASAVGDSSDNLAGTRKLKLSEEEIQKVKEEYEEKQRQRKEKEKQAADATKGEEKDEEKDKEKKDNAKDKPSTSGQQPSQSSPSPRVTPTPPAHQRYTLHREMFAMRLGVHRKRRQTAQAKEIAPRLPSAPRAPVFNTPRT